MEVDICTYSHPHGILPLIFMQLAVLLFHEITSKAINPLLSITSAIFQKF